ncbi:MAG: Na(+)/H(+) antiporter subunit B, partial [Flavobacterium sp.]|nr:Na(+)/H(+) antiporter subunit B [Flavobacterium sp.]
GTDDTMKLLRRKPLSLILIGLIIAALSMVLPAFWGVPIMTGIWFEYNIPIIGTVGTALFFDIGVYLVVVGVVLTILFTISQSTH